MVCGSTTVGEEVGEREGCGREIDGTSENGEKEEDMMRKPGSHEWKELCFRKINFLTKFYSTNF